MQLKNCQMIVADNYQLALQKSKVKQNSDYEHDQFNELRKSDLTGFCVINPNEEFHELQAIWSNFFNQEQNLESRQQRLEGSDIPGRKMKPFKLLSLPLLSSELLHFSYFDDNKNLCSFTLEVLVDCPTIWFASLVTNKAAALDQRQIVVFIPEFSNQLTKQNIELKWFENSIEAAMKMEEAHLFNMNRLHDYLGYVLNNHFIKYSLDNLFDSFGTVNLEHFRMIKSSLHNQASMFAFPKDKIEELSKRCELDKILASKIKIKAISENSENLNPQINLIKQAIEDYSPENYNKVIQDPDIQRFKNNYQSLKSREVDEIFCSEILFPQDCFDSQSLKLSLISGAFKESSLKNVVKVLHNEIIKIFKNLNALTGYKKESLIKDLIILSSLLLEPTPKNFKKLAERIKTNEEAISNREFGGHFITSTILGLLGTAGLTVVFTPVSVVLPLAAASFGFFAGTGSALVSYNSSEKRASYNQKLKQVGNEINKYREKDKLLEQLRKILIQNKDGKNAVGSTKIMNVFETIKYTNNLNKICNALAEVIYIFNETDIKTANELKKMRSDIGSNLPKLNLLADPDIETINCLPAAINSNISRLKAHFATEFEEYNEAINFNEKIKTAIVSLILRQTKNSVRDLILQSFIATIKNEGNLDCLITALDDAIFSLFENSKNSKLAEDLLTIRLLYEQGKHVATLELPVIESSLSFQ